MVFNQDSGLVQFWGRKVIDGTYKFKDVPALYNLKEEVEIYLNSKNYDWDLEER